MGGLFHRITEAVSGISMLGYAKLTFLILTVSLLTIVGYEESRDSLIVEACEEPVKDLVVRRVCDTFLDR